MLADGDGFTRREREVAGLAAAGLTNAEIARKLGVTRNAIRFHLKEIRTKLHTGGDRDILRQRFLPAPASAGKGGEQNGPMCHLERRSRRRMARCGAPRLHLV